MSKALMGKGKYYILITLFFTGAAIMVLELLGARIIGPYYGVSLYVWSSLITITLIALAIGYFVGGHIADKRPKISMLYLFILLAGLYLLLIPTISAPILKASNALGIRGGTLLSAFMLFTIPLILLGTVIPYAIKLLTSELKTLGTTAGNLYAISTVGSCAGTILTGFILIPNIGVTRILYLLAFLLILLWAIWMIFSKKFAKGLIALPFLAICLSAALATPKLFARGEVKIVYKAESLYGQVKVLDKGDQRWLLLDGVSHTVTYREKGESILPYTYFIELLPYLNPEADNALIIGLGGGSISRAFQKYGLKVESVEIDPEVVGVARKYFGFKGKVIISDGRTYIGKTKKKYDFVIFDAYSSDVIPVHLTTKEVFKEVKEILKNEGILAINCVGFWQGKESIAYKSLHKTLKQVFPYTKAYSTKDEIGNIVIFASDKEMKIKAQKKYRNRAVKYWHGRMEKRRIDGDLEKGIILTDDYNPIEILTAKYSEEWRRSTFKTLGKELLLK